MLFIFQGKFLAIPPIHKVSNALHQIEPTLTSPYPSLRYITTASSQNIHKSKEFFYVKRDILFGVPCNAIRQRKKMLHVKEDKRSKGKHDA